MLLLIGALALTLFMFVICMGRFVHRVSNMAHAAKEQPHKMVLLIRQDVEMSKVCSDMNFHRCS